MRKRYRMSPILYSSNLELIERVIMTSGLPYTFLSAYGVEVPDLSPNDVLHLNAQAEVTNENGFTVMVDGAFSNGLTHGAFKAVGLPTCGQNVTPDMHHMVVARQAWVKGLTGSVFFSFVLCAASDAMTATKNYITLNKYGGIQVAVFKS
jgi:hypothetical protein